MVVRATVYARFSTERQSETSIADQIRVCRAYAKAQGWKVAGEYTDEGISGAALGNRPGAQAALRDIAAGGALLVTDLSRLSRSQDLAPLLTRLRHRGVRVIGVQDGFDSDSRTARMQAGLSGIMSEEFRTMVADRTRSALELRARTGQPTGGKAYDNPKVVREIFTRFAGGESLKAIASDLNRRGIPSPGAGWKARSGVRGRWLVSALHALLKNERYAGRLIWNKSQWVKDPDSGKRTRRERPESEWIVQEIDPVVDRKTFDKAQSRFRKNAGVNARARRHLLSGILECGVCGAKMVVVGGSQSRYVCSQYHGGGIHACSNTQSVPRSVAEAAILAPVEKDLLSPAAIREGVKMLRAERAKAEKNPEPVDREVIELERLVREGVVSAETMAPALREARRKAQARRSDGEPKTLPWPSEALWRETVKGMAAVLRGGNVEAARDVLQQITGPIRLEPGEGHMVAELNARQIRLATGTFGICNGSGGVLRIHLPHSTRGK